MRPVALTWVLQKNGLAASKADAQEAIIHGRISVNGKMESSPQTRLPAGTYRIERDDISMVVAVRTK
jgi:ribosomal protein S4